VPAAAERVCHALDALFKASSMVHCWSLTSAKQDTALALGVVLRCLLEHAAHAKVFATALAALLSLEQSIGGTPVFYSNLFAAQDPGELVAAALDAHRGDDWLEAKAVAAIRLC